MVTNEELDRKIGDLRRELGDHMLEDAERHGQIIAALAEMKGDVKYLRKTTESQEEKIENTGSHNVAQLQKKADFWPNLIIGAIVTLSVSAITGLVVYFVTHH